MMSFQVQNGFEVMPFPLERQLVLDAGWIHRNKATISGLLEVDVTRARRLIQEHKVNTGETLSFTAFILACLGKALETNKQLNAYRNWRNQLVVFDEVDVAVMVEIDIEERKFPLLHVIRAVNKKSLLDIHNEIRAVQTDASRSTNFNPQKKKFMGWFLRLPAFARHAAYYLVLSNPHWFKRFAGTVSVSAVGMFISGSGWGLGLPNHTLSITLGGISEKPVVMDGQIAIRQILGLTVSVDHVIVDGAPAARFIQQLSELIESGSALEMGD